MARCWLASALLCHSAMTHLTVLQNKQLASIVNKQLANIVLLHGAAEYGGAPAAWHHASLALAHLLPCSAL